MNFKICQKRSGKSAKSGKSANFANLPKSGVIGPKEKNNDDGCEPS